MKSISNEQMCSTVAGGCDFFTGLGCGVSVGAILSGVGGYFGVLGAIATCGSLISDCYK